ncbi:MAG: DUF3822 family protein [Flavobacteriales bacterium]|nr:DUF3822 family protein [Flavobacteriales bacterium]
MAIEGVTTGAYRANDYRPEEERRYHVGIVIGPALSAWVVRDARNTHVAALAWAAEERALKHADLPQHPRSVTFVALPEWSTLVPDGALEPGTAVDHLTLVHGKLPSHLVREEPVQPLGAQCLYVNESIHERAVLDRYPIARSLPLQGVLVHGARTRSMQGPTMLMHRGGERLDIAIADKGNLLLSSSYPARTAEDVLYFCLMAADRVGCDPGRLAVRLGGTHLMTTDRELLGRYFVDTASAVPPTTMATIPTTVEVDRWLAAFDQFACVS